MSRTAGIAKLCIALVVASIVVLIAGSVFGSHVGSISFWVICLASSLYVLVRSADLFIKYAEKFGSALGLSPFILGVTVVALGTSLPELVSSLIAVLHGSTEFVSGNVVGSNIANIFLVLGVAAVMSKGSVKISSNLIKNDLPLLVGSAFYLVATFWDGVFTATEAVLALLFFTVYMMYATSENRLAPDERKDRFDLAHLGFILVGFVGLVIGARYTVVSSLALTNLFGIADVSWVALSAVAIGTSLPELAVSVYAARRGQFDIAVGNIIGSNIFNTFFVMGVPGLFTTLTIPALTLTTGLVFMVAATLLCVFVFLDQEMSQFEGMFFVLLFVLFLGKLFSGL